jgi:hypothetical protein
MNFSRRDFLKAAGQGLALTAIVADSQERASDGRHEYPQG